MAPVGLLASEPGGGSGSLLVDLRPFALGLAVTPAAIAAGILLLGSTRPVADGVAFTAPFVPLSSAVPIAVRPAPGAR